MKLIRIALPIVFVVASVILSAQPGPQLPPHQIQPDNKVTFQIKAPQAAKVDLRGDWPGGLGGNSASKSSRNVNVLAATVASTAFNARRWSSPGTIFVTNCPSPRIA